LDRAAKRYATAVRGYYAHQPGDARVRKRQSLGGTAARWRGEGREARRPARRQPKHSILRPSAPVLLARCRRRRHRSSRGAREAAAAAADCSAAATVRPTGHSRCRWCLSCLSRPFIAVNRRSRDSRCAPLSLNNRLDPSSTRYVAPRRTCYPPTSATMFAGGERVLVREAGS